MLWGFQMVFPCSQTANRIVQSFDCLICDTISCGTSGTKAELVGRGLEVHSDFNSVPTPERGPRKCWSDRFAGPIETYWNWNLSLRAHYSSLMFWVSHCSCGVLIHCVFSSLMSFAHKNARNAAVARRDASNGKQISAWRCSQSFFFMSLV